MSQAEEAGAIRSFNRFWTSHMGVLDAGLLDTPYSLTEARVLFELGQRGAGPQEDGVGSAGPQEDDTMDLLRLRQELGIDAGYLSRIVKRFERAGLVDATPSPADGRRRVLRLTERGRAVFEDLDARSTKQVQDMQSRLTEEERRRLASAMATIRALVDPVPGSRASVIRQPISGDLGWVVHRHGVIYAQEFGWDETFEALVARVVAEYIDERDPKRENAWIAEVDGDPVGCVFCVKESVVIARLRLLLVEPSARGVGIGERLVTECIRFARRAGYKQITLWTNDVLLSARRIYEAAGFRLIKEEPHHSFGHDLVGQDWLLDLDAGTD
ncbi:MAG: bifunctional helix-turn-helix transcriptional regulator/GNAT family N-acetyltransferase [Actinomycetota bacterium]